MIVDINNSMQSTTKDNNSLREYNGNKYILGHWCDENNRWKLSPHRFLVHNTFYGLIGQFITTTWFGCDIYPGKTFIVISIPKDKLISTIESKLNKSNFTPTNLVPYANIIEVFIIPSIDTYKKSLSNSDECAYIDIMGVANSNNKFKLVLRKTRVLNSKYSIYGTLPNFILKKAN